MEGTKKSLWMPVTKDTNGEYHAVLTDTSLDRDDEAMDRDMILDWGRTKGLPSLANHENKMEKWVGGWDNIKGITKGTRAAITAKPWFFSKDANPLAAQIQKQVDEAIEKGLNPGISIGAMVHEHEMRKIDGKEIKVYTQGELLEATWVPIQSNRNASYGHIAKQFDLEMTKPKQVDECVKALKADPDFKPQKGKTKEESAWAVCQAKYGKSFENQKEGNNMESELTQKDIDSAVEANAEKLNKDFETKMAEKDKEIEKLSKDLEESKKSLENKETEMTDKVKQLETEIEKTKNEALEKAKLANQPPADVAVSPEEAKKALDEGKIPVFRQ